jgi:hypothetical protein
MPTSNPRTGLGLAAIVIVAAVIVGGVWTLSTPPGRRISHRAAAPPVVAIPAVKAPSDDGGATVLELPPSVTLSQREPQTAGEGAPSASVHAAPAPQVGAGYPGGVPRGSGWVDYFAPPAAGAGSAVSSSAGNASSAGTVASNGSGLSVGILSGGEDDGSGPQSSVRSRGPRHPGWVLIAGGAAGRKAATRRAELFNPKRMRWVGTGAMHRERENHTATLLPSGDTLVAGGENAKGAALASAELYNFRKGRFSVTGAMQTARGGHTATLIAGCACSEDGKVLIAGGTTELVHGGPLATSELYDPASGQFAATGAMNTARSGATATLIASGPMAGEVLIAGGIGAGGAILDSAEIYDPRTGTFSATGAMTAAREYHTATWLAYLKDSGPMAGEILIAGGQTPAGVTSSAEVYDPTSGTFSAIASMTAARATQDAVLMTDGRVLVAGGFGTGENFLNSAEIFNPTDGTFVPTASMASVHTGGDGVLLSDGRVLIAGGHSSSADVYDPVSGTFAMTTPMRVALLGAPAVTLP